MKLFNTLSFLVLFIGIAFIFYKPFILDRHLPIPSDAMVGLYHPFRDLYVEEYPRGIPFKNFLITDPVRQTFIWKELALESLSSGRLALWNPYEMAGKPLAGNSQSSPFYPLNILLLFRPLAISWSVFIMAQTVLGGVFMCLYLRNLRLSHAGAFIGSLSFAFSGFFIAWLEWGTVLHAALWLPLILFSVDKCSRNLSRREGFLWWVVLIFSLSSSFLAGHLQTFFYVFSFSSIYALARLLPSRKKLRFVLLGIAAVIVFILSTFIQWIQTMTFISNSARSIDQTWTSEGWFLPWQNLIQFIIPDFFGNPSTLNYWGVWNYAEFSGYVGVIPLLSAFFALFYVRRKIVYFFAAVIFISVIFMTQNVLSELPFRSALPLISTAQPTRIIFLIVFSLSVLAGFGFSALDTQVKMRWMIMLPFLGLLLVYGLVGAGVYLDIFGIETVHAQVALRNFILPFGIAVVSVFLIAIMSRVVSWRIQKTLLVILVAFTIFDLLRFANKFTPFTDGRYLYPDTQITNYLKSESQKDQFRIATLNNEILPPNFATYYRIQSVAGYDPLYLKTYAEFIAAMERGNVDINPPFGFNRIINPSNFHSPLFDLLNVRYLLTFEEVVSEKYSLVLEEGRTKLYEVVNPLPRLFFVESVVTENSPREHISRLSTINHRDEAVVFSSTDLGGVYSDGTAIIEEYSGNKVIVNTVNEGEGYLVFLDTYYELWGAKIDGDEVEIYRTDYAFRGVRVPPGEHTIEFEMKAF